MCFFIQERDDHPKVKPESTVICWPVIEAFCATETYKAAQSSRYVCQPNSEKWLFFIGQKAYLVL